MNKSVVKKVESLHGNPSNTRNVCILAHVDHGKTTLADNLVASNGIISHRMAGKLRYMDSREDEQVRGITMKSSAISLHFKNSEKDYLVNLIDSPGHIDFSSEVSTAVRLCDGAVVVVDVVEGVCPQTYAVLRQAWLEKIKPVLVLNKMDRLIKELEMTPLEAFLHLQNTLEQVNAITGELLTSQVLATTGTETGSLSPNKKAEEHIYDWSSGLELTDDSKLYFSPEQGNVVFASALDGWGFGIAEFAEMYSQKLGVKSDILQKTLWGDFYLNNKDKRIMKGAQAKGKKPLFVQFILENIWAVYDTVGRRDKERISKIVKSLKLEINSRDLNHNDGKVVQQAIFRQWLPLAQAVLAMVVGQLPSPLDISVEKVEQLMCTSIHSFNSLPSSSQLLKQDFLACSPAEEAPVIGFISKMCPVDIKHLPQNKHRPLTQEEIIERREKARQNHALKNCQQQDGPVSAQEQVDTQADIQQTVDKDEGPKKEHVFVAFARLFSGTLQKGRKLYILGPKFNPATLSQQELNIPADTYTGDIPHVSVVTVDDLYVFMGRELEAVENIPAGNVLGMGGLEDYVLKSATISSTLNCPPFTEMQFEAAPIVRVAIEPKNTGDMSKLVNGLRLLNQADPCVELLVQETGEHVIIAAGEVHLQRCIDDITKLYAKIEVNVSPPIVPFRETIIIPPTIDMVNEVIEETNQPSRDTSKQNINRSNKQDTTESNKQDMTGSSKQDDTEADTEKEGPTNGITEVKTANGRCTVGIRAAPLPEAATKLLLNNAQLLKTLAMHIKTTENESKSDNQKSLNIDVVKGLQTLKCQLTEAFNESNDPIWTDAIDRIWCVGPRHNGPNILLNRIEGYNRPSIWSVIEDSNSKLNLWEYDNSIASGFQLATLSGPICEEPMMGVGFIIEKWELHGRKHKLSTNEGTEKDDDELKSQDIIETPINTTDDKQDIEDDNTESDSDSDDHTDEEINETTKKLSKITFVEPRSDEGPPIRQKVLAHGPFSGQLMSCVKYGCRKAFQSQPQRLMAAMYACEIQCTAEVLGKMYGVLGKRNGRILSDDMKEGTQMFNVEAVLPIIESFGFAEEIRKKTSGLASPQLKFTHWEVVDVDPYWVPTTDEEYIHFGEKADSANQAEKYMNQVRKRKGLKVQEKIVEHAEKQRTLKKNK